MPHLDAHSPTLEALLAWLRVPQDGDLALGQGGYHPDTWHSLTDWAASRDLLPLLAEQMRVVDALPAALRSRLQRVKYTTAAHNLLLLQALGRLLAAFNAGDIPVIVLKGAVLAETVYPSLACRPMGDVDLLIRREHLESAIRVLRGQGYDYPEMGVLDHSAHFAMRFGGELSFYRDTPPGPAVDLHWRLFNPEWLEGVIRVDEAGLWERACPVSIDGVSALQLSPEDTVWYLCLHLALHHQGTHLRMLVDIDRVIRSALPNGLDFDAVVQRAIGYRIRGFVYLPLALARQWLHTPVPAEALQALRPAQWRLCLIHHLVPPESVLTGRNRAAGKSERLLQLLLVDHMGDRLKMARQALLPSSTWIAERYNIHGRGPVLAYTLWHLVRIISFALRSLRQILCPGESQAVAKKEMEPRTNV